MISSSSQEERDNLYGKSKKEGREALANWAQENGGKITGLIIPNVFGAFGKPFYNSFISTFCYQLTHCETPTIATVSDPEALKNQAFFVDAKKGYKVLIYSNAKKAFLYDPSADKIVNIAPLNTEASKTTAPSTNSETKN